MTDEERAKQVLFDLEMKRKELSKTRGEYKGNRIIFKEIG